MVDQLSHFLPLTPVGHCFHQARSCKLCHFMAKTISEGR